MPLTNSLLKCNCHLNSFSFYNDNGMINQNIQWLLTKCNIVNSFRDWNTYQTSQQYDSLSGSKSSRQSQKKMRKVTCTEAESIHRWLRKKKEADFLSGSKSVVLLIKKTLNTEPIPHIQMHIHNQFTLYARSIPSAFSHLFFSFFGSIWFICFRMGSKTNH